MILLLKGLLAFITMIVFPTLIGGIITKYIDTKYSFISNIVFGYLLEFAIFQLVTVPMILIGASFNSLVVIYILWNTILSVVSLKMNYPALKDFLKCDFLSCKKSEICLVAILLVLIAIQVYGLVGYMHEDDDDIFYVSAAVTSIYNNSMFKISPQTGESIGFEWKYVIGPFPMYNAVISKIVHIHPTIMAHTILPAIFIPLCYGVYYLLAKKLFKDDKTSTLIFLIFLCIANIFGNYTKRTPASFLLFRIWQGKAMLANYIIPMFWLLWLRYESDSKYAHILFIIALFAGMFTTSMGTIFLPMILCTLAFIKLIREKDLKEFSKTIACCLPIVLYAPVYVISKLLGVE